MYTYWKVKQLFDIWSPKIKKELLEEVFIFKLRY